MHIRSWLLHLAKFFAFMQDQHAASKKGRNFASLHAKNG
jgi:hypothetical protein